MKLARRDIYFSASIVRIEDGLLFGSAGRHWLCRPWQCVGSPVSDLSISDSSNQCGSIGGGSRSSIPFELKPSTGPFPISSSNTQPTFHWAVVGCSQSKPTKLLQQRCSGRPFLPKPKTVLPRSFLNLQLLDK